MRIHTYTPGIRSQAFIKNFLVVESDHGVVNKVAIADLFFYF